MPRQYIRHYGTLTERFWAKVNKDGPLPADASLGPCWLWTACTVPTGPKGYGIIQFEKRPYLAHRLSYELHHGTDPGPLCVLHKCDNPQCVNPSHLFLGTHADNMKDCRQKGRQATGERCHPKVFRRGQDHPAAKLTELRVQSIRERFAVGGISIIKLAEDFGVSPELIRGVVNRRRWKHVG